MYFKMEVYISLIKKWTVWWKTCYMLTDRKYIIILICNLNKSYLYHKALKNHSTRENLSNLPQVYVITTPINFKKSKENIFWFKLHCTFTTECYASWIIENKKKPYANLYKKIISLFWKCYWHSINVTCY